MIQPLPAISLPEPQWLPVIASQPPIVDMLLVDQQPPLPIGFGLDSQVSQLVQAMATFSASDAGVASPVVRQAPQDDPHWQIAISSSFHF
jgi:hypothetical protein